MQLTNEIICTQALGDVLSVCVCVCLNQALLCTESPQSGLPLRVGYNPDYCVCVCLCVCVCVCMCMSYQSRGIIRNSMVPLTNLDKGGVVTRPSRVTRGRAWLCITWCRKNGRHIIPLRYMTISNSIDKHTQTHKQHRYTHTHTHTHTHTQRKYATD